MTSTTRIQRRYDHRLREMVCNSKNIDAAVGCGVPRSTARGWLAPNHPHVRQKIADPSGRIARLLKEIADPGVRIEELYLATLSRLPSEQEKQACLSYVSAAESPENGLGAVLWSLLNTREFVLLSWFSPIWTNREFGLAG